MSGPEILEVRNYLPQYNSSCACCVDGVNCYIAWGGSNEHGRFGVKFDRDVDGDIRHGTIEFNTSRVRCYIMRIGVDESGCGWGRVTEYEVGRCGFCQRNTGIGCHVTRVGVSGDSAVQTGLTVTSLGMGLPGGMGAGLTDAGWMALHLTGLRPKPSSTSATQLNCVGLCCFVVFDAAQAVSDRVCSCTLLQVSSIPSHSPASVSHCSTSHSLVSFCFLLLFLPLSTSPPCPIPAPLCAVLQPYMILQCWRDSNPWRCLLSRS